MAGASRRVLADLARPGDPQRDSCDARDRGQKTLTQFQATRGHVGVGFFDLAQVHAAGLVATPAGS
jgi:hypothetical protein